MGARLNNDHMTNINDSDNIRSNINMQPPAPQRQSSLNRLRSILNPVTTYDEGISTRDARSDDDDDTASTTTTDNGMSNDVHGNGNNQHGNKQRRRSASGADHVRLHVNSQDNTITIIFDDGSTVTVEVHPNEHDTLHAKVKQQCCSHVNLQEMDNGEQQQQIGNNNHTHVNETIAATKHDDDRTNELSPPHPQRQSSHFHIHIPPAERDDTSKQHLVEQATTHTKPSTSSYKATINEVRKTDDGSYTIIHHIKKYRGRRQATPKYVTFHEGLSAFIATFLSIAVLALLQFNAMELGLNDTRDQFLIGSFGASAVLLYGAIESDLSQPRNVIGGHVVSAFVGVSIHQIFAACNGGTAMVWLECAFAVSVAITAMNSIRCLHPPAGATALIAVMPSPKIQDIGWLYIGLPVATGACIMLIIAVIFNNMPRKRHWPKSWI
jgi:CBS domain-containing membrane protein